MDKQTLRNLIRTIKKDHPAEQLAEWSSLICTALVRHPRFEHAKTLFLYHALPDEVQTHSFISQWYQHKKIVLPVVKDEELELRYYTSPQDLQCSDYGILEPTGPLVTDWQTIDLTIVPGLAFDHQCNRMGRGKGYYDRTLGKLQHSYNIGVCFDFQLFEMIPTETHDRKMDEVITEKHHFIRVG